MRCARRSVISTFASLAMVAGLAAGCSGSAWQFGKSSDATTVPSATTEPAGTTAAATTEPATAHPATTVETAMAPPAASDGFAPLPGVVDVRFRPGQVTLASADHRALDGVVRWLKEHQTAVVMIEGHTDDLGTREGNLAAGEKRAQAIMNYLVEKEIQPARILITSAGSDHPLCVEKTDACRAKNRRARFLVKQP
jgi:peptidoglycan-associated lipoprotein